MKMLTSTTKKMHRVYETEDSFGEYQIFDKTVWYFLHIPVWYKISNIEDRPITEFLRSKTGY